MKRKISICLSLLQRRHGDMFALETAKTIGADGIQFSLTHHDFRNSESIYSRSDAEIAEYFSALHEKAAELDLEICQTHGRFVICHRSPEETEAAMRNARLDCMASHYLHSGHVVFHGVIKEAADTDAEYRHLNEVQLCRILDFAREFDVNVAMETDGLESLFGQLREFVASYDRIRPYADDPARFVVCVDTGHTHKSVGYDGNPSVGDTIRLLGDRIACLHLHDNNGISDQHRLPTAGSIDWADVFDALDEIGYSGWYNLELSLNQLKKFGKGFEIEYAAFAVKMLRFMLHRRYGEGSCSYTESDNSWLSYARICDTIN